MLRKNLFHFIMCILVLWNIRAVADDQQPLKASLECEPGFQLKNNQGELCIYSGIIAVEPPWKQLRFYTQKTKLEKKSETHENKTVTHLFSADKNTEIYLEDYSLTTGQNAWQLNVELRQNGNAPTKVEYTALHLPEEALLPGGDYRWTDTDHKEHFGKLRNAPHASIWKFLSLELSTSFGTLTIKVNHGLPLSFADRRVKTYWGRKSFWIGSANSPISKDAPFKHNVTVTLKPYPEKQEAKQLFKPSANALPSCSNHKGFRVDRTTSYETVMKNLHGDLCGNGKYLWSDYLALLDELAKKDRYLVLPGREFLTKEDPSRIVVYMRHDIDFDPITALKMAKEENKRNLHATYYVLPTAPYYGRQMPDGVERYACMDQHYAKIRDWGHDIGVHNDLFSMMLLWDIDPLEFQRQELEYWRNAGFPVVGVVSHGSNVVLKRKLNNAWIFSEWNKKGEYTLNGKTYRYGEHSFKDFRFLYEGYLLKANHRESDISGYQTGATIVEHLKSFQPGDRVSLLTHPCHWRQID